MESMTVYALLFVAVVAGWLLGRLGSSTPRMPKATSSDLFQDYFVGLNYLLNDEPDEAIDTFINALEINSETVETHLALGTLLRRRGKVDKAITVHQALLARPNLEKSFSNSVRLQLALNYIAAGLLDRAERLLKEILEDGSEAQWDAHIHLITIYQTEKEWENAISCSVELLKNSHYKKNEDLRGAAAHFCCELAEQHFSSGQLAEARVQIKRAFTFERKSVRAMLLLADIEIQAGNFKAAIKELQRIRSAKPEFIPQMLERFAVCYAGLNSDSEFEKLLHSMVSDDSSGEAALMLADRIANKSGSEAATELLNRQLISQPSIQGLVELLSMQLENVDPNIATHLESLLNLIREQTQKSADYQCRQCGFETKSFFWMCPSCKKWDKIK